MKKLKKELTLCDIVEKIDEVNTSLNKKIDEVNTNLNKKIDEKIDEVKTELSQKIDDKVDELARITNGGFDRVEKRLQSVEAVMNTTAILTA